MNRDLTIASSGDAIRGLRMAQGLSLQDVATRIGWDKSRLSKYETNRLDLSIEVIEQIAQALGHPPLFVVLKCLKHRYPELGSRRSKLGRLLDSVVRELSGPSGKRD